MSESPLANDPGRLPERETVLVTKSFLLSLASETSLKAKTRGTWVKTLFLPLATGIVAEGIKVSLRKVLKGLRTQRTP